jgi:hypothetical protein
MNSFVEKRTVSRLFKTHEVYQDANVSFGCMNKEEQPAHEISIWVDGGCDTVYYVLNMDRDTAKTVVRHLTRMLKLNCPGA